MIYYLLIFFILILNIFFLGYSYPEPSRTDLVIQNINNTLGTNFTMNATKELDFHDILKKALSSFNFNDYESAIIWYNKALTLNP